MTFKNFYSLVKKQRMRSRFDNLYFSRYDTYDSLLYLLRIKVVFVKKRIGKYKFPAAENKAKNDLKIALERIQFVNKCKNNDF